MTRAFSEFLRVDNDGQLRFDGLAAADLADRFGTPLYVISEQQIHENVRAISQAFRRRYPRTEILFANKANNNPAVRAVFSQAGARRRLLRLQRAVPVDSGWCARGPARSEWQ